jgi:hypothetical protein
MFRSLLPLTIVVFIYVLGPLGLIILDYMSLSLFTFIAVVFLNLVLFPLDDEFTPLLIFEKVELHFSLPQQEIIVRLKLLSKI